MCWAELRATVLSRALEGLLGEPEPGSMAFVRCLSPGVVEELSRETRFAPYGWVVYRVTDAQSEPRSITADHAVEMRERKDEPVLLLVDTGKAGAGMDGIYSAAREVEEGSLFDIADRLVGQEIKRRRSAPHRAFAMRAIKTAGRRGRSPVPRWWAFDFLCRSADPEAVPGAFVHLLGLWPILTREASAAGADLDLSRRFVDRLLGPESARWTPAERIAALRLDSESERTPGDLERFLLEVETEPLFPALQKLAGRPELWVGRLRTLDAAAAIRRIELTSWRNRNDALAKWSGLSQGEPPPEPPVLILNRDTGQSDRSSTLEVRWKPEPFPLEKNAVEYEVRVVTDQDEPIAAATVSHRAAKGGEKHRFRVEDFDATLDADAVVPAKVTLSVAGNTTVETKESEEFVIRFGEQPAAEAGGAGRKYRTLSEGLAELRERSALRSALGGDSHIRDDPKGGRVVLRAKTLQRSLRVARPALIAEVERRWLGHRQIGRWRVKVRASGSRVGTPEFVKATPTGGKTIWQRAANATRRLADRFGEVGGVGQTYDDRASDFRGVQEYLRAWIDLLNNGDPVISLASTVEVRSLSDQLIGLIVLPAHPLRIAWLAAYDNLVFHARFEQGQQHHQIIKEFAALDGALCPAFLPGPEPESPTLVFADTLGFHAAAMAPDNDPEPKATAAVLSRALEPRESEEFSPTLGARSAQIVGAEIIKYLECHHPVRLFHLNALRAGDGLTVVRALGDVRKRRREDSASDEETVEAVEDAPEDIRFSVQFFSSASRRSASARFLAESTEKRRRGAGDRAEQDRWVFESSSHRSGITQPVLRWARREEELPETMAHVAVAFDTFESAVELSETIEAAPPHHAFGLLSFYDRQYSAAPTPRWTSANWPGTEGEKHPSRRSHTETLTSLEEAVQRAVGRRLGGGKGLPVLQTEISNEKEVSLEHLHRLSDWVVTLDRNAGLEYFDSPRENREIYDAYVIDCVPEREDLGSLQLITSTAKLEEVHRLFDAALETMGMQGSPQYAEFLLQQLKALSGRLAIRLTGQRPPTAELIALALTYRGCQEHGGKDSPWPSLEDGFLIPVDDVQDLLPVSKGSAAGAGRTRPDLIHVSTAPRRGLAFQFIEVKYRRHLRAARAPELLDQIGVQTGDFRKRWDDWYGAEECSAFRAVRRARLARILRFYVDKAHRHCLRQEKHGEIRAEINRMVGKGSGYRFSASVHGDRGFVFCPEQRGSAAVPVSSMATRPEGLQIFAFGPEAVRPELDLCPDETKPETSTGEPTTRQPPVREAESSTDRSGQDGRESNHDTHAAETKDTQSRSTKETDAPELADPPSIRLGDGLRSGTPARWPLSVKGNPHLLIAGLPGMGKTTCLLNLCTQMIENDVWPIIFSWHEDIDERLKGLTVPVHAVDFDGLSFNPLEVLDRSTPRAWLDVAGALRDIFAAIYPELGDLQTGHIWRAIKESFEEAGWTSSTDTSPDLREPPFRRFVEILRDRPKPDRGMRSLLQRLEELDAYGFFDAHTGGGSLWENAVPTVIRVHQTQNELLQRAFSSLVFYSLYKNMFRRGVQKRITHAVIFDEAHRAARLKLIPTMAKECRKYGISLVLASQEARDFHSSVFSAIANYLVLRLTDADARALVRNVASSREERALMDRIKQMERFRALYFREGDTRPAAIQLKDPLGVVGPRAKD